MAIKDNFQRPEGLAGRLLLTAMNMGHSPMAKWAFKQFALPRKADIVDLGCGGGANIKRLLEACPEGKVFGVDLSEESVRKSKRVNKKDLGTRCKVIQGNVAALPFKTASFDIATAFETVYFWPHIEICFKEVRRILKDGGLFIVVNDSGDPDGRWEDRIPGMTDYLPGDIKALMKEAGFENITITSERFKYCVIGRAAADERTTVMPGTDTIKNEIASVVREAGDIILRAEMQRGRLQSKAGHANFVTEYDEQVQEYLIGKLCDLLPEASFLGEEEGKDVFREEYRRGLLFIIDPIDGTSNFMNGYSPYVISVALFKDACPYIGIIYNPVSGQLFSAETGKGAYVEERAVGGAGEAVSQDRQGAEDMTNGIVTRPLKVSDKPLGQSLVSFGTSPYRSDLSAETFRLCAAYLPKCIDLRRSGAAAWDLAMVASGRTGLYFEWTLGIWDYAAGALIVKEAGGTVRQLNGDPLTFSGPSSVLAYGSGIREEDLIFG